MARSPSAPFRRTTRTACIVRLRVERFVGGEAGQGVRSQLERVDDAAVAAAQGLLGLDPLEARGTGWSRFARGNRSRASTMQYVACLLVRSSCPLLFARSIAMAAPDTAPQVSVRPPMPPPSPSAARKHSSSSAPISGASVQATAWAQLYFMPCSSSARRPSASRSKGRCVQALSVVMSRSFRSVAAMIARRGLSVAVRFPFGYPETVTEGRRRKRRGLWTSAPFSS